MSFTQIFLLRNLRRIFGGPYTNLRQSDQYSKVEHFFLETDYCLDKF
jgi:hypothetical protein